MFLKNVIFWHFILLQIVFSLNNNRKVSVVSTTQEPLNLDQKPLYLDQEPNSVDLELDFNNFAGDRCKSILQNHKNTIVNEMKNYIGELRYEILLLKNDYNQNKRLCENDIQTQLEEQKEQLTIWKNQFAEYRKWSENSIEIQWKKFEQKQNNYTKTYLENLFKQHNNIVNEMNSQFETTRKEISTIKENSNQFDEFKNWSKNNIQTEWQKFEQKQKDLQLLQNNFTKTYLEKSHYNLQKLIETMLQNQCKQHNNIVNEIKSQLETTIKEILTLKENYNQFDVYKKSLETKIDLLISHSNDTKTYLENVNNKLAGLTRPKSCTDVQESGKTLSGVYKIWPDFSHKSFDVWCDMETRGGGWIYVINRFDGSVDFDLGWDDYKNGFGSLNGEHWLGLEHLYLLTKSKPTELLIELVYNCGKKSYAYYKEFRIGDESEGYPIDTIGYYSGDAGNDFGRHSGWKFSTRDRDQDTAWTNCAQSYGGGFWYGNCYHILFTGDYHNKGIRRYGKLWDKGFKKVKMMIRF